MIASTVRLMARLPYTASAYRQQYTRYQAHNICHLTIYLVREKIGRGDDTTEDRCSLNNPAAPDDIRSGPHSRLTNWLYPSPITYVD